MTCTIFDLSGPPHSGKTTIAMAIALGLPAGIEHVYGAQTSSWAALLNRRHPGINATGQKITAATLGENVRVVVIDDHPPAPPDPHQPGPAPGFVFSGT